MSAIVGIMGWGRGVRPLSPSDMGSGGSGSPVEAEGLTDEQFEALQGQDAKEAVASLSGDFADGQLPEIETVTFPGPIAEAFYWSNDDVAGIQGPVGSGKTTTLMKSRLRRAVEMPRSVIDGKRRYKVLFIRETYRQLWSSSIPSYLETFPRSLGQWSGGRGDPVRHVIEFEDAYGPIEFVAEFMAFGDDIYASMRGIQTTDIVLNETDTMPAEILSVGIGRIDRWPAREHFAGLPLHLRSYGQIVGDFNAPDEDNWTFGVFHDEEARKRLSEELTASLPEGAKPITIEFFNQPGYGEPGCENLQNLSPGYYARQIASNKLNGRGDINARLVYNRVTYLRVGDPVFQDEYSPRIHVSDQPLEVHRELPLLIGLDQGFKGAAVIAQCVGYYRWRVLAEVHFPKKRLLAAAFGLKLRELLDERFDGLRIECGYGDMAGEHGASQAADENDTWNLIVGRTAEFIVRPQVIGTNRIQPRLEAVRAALEAPIEGGQPGLILDPSCAFLKRGFAARYVWKDEIDASGDKRKVPDKHQTEANVMDALQYLLLSGHDGRGMSPYAKRIPGTKQPGKTGHNGRPQWGREEPGGLKSGWNVQDPYGANQ